ncbi:MAG: response regulator [Bacteroidota bacterium]
MKTSQQSNNTGNEKITSPRYECIMLVDDNSIDNFINKQLVESCGFASEVMVCQSAKEGLQHLMGGKNLPQVIFLDINMPDMSGFEFLEAFQQLPEMIKHHCRIVMLSSSESFKDLNRANKSPYVRKFLNKPLTADILAAIKV